MIKLFRSRQRRNLRESNTFKYFRYALGEILLVVIGILIALQVSTWNQQRQDRKTEQRILLSLQSDLESDIQILEQYIQSTSKRLASVDSIVNILNKPEEYSIMDFLQYQVGLTLDNYFVANRATFDEGVASGTLKLIRNDSLRKGVFDHYRYLSNDRNNDHSSYQITNNIIVPTIVEEIFSSADAIGRMGIDGKDLPHLDLKEIAKNQRYLQVLIYARGDNFLIREWKTTQQRSLELINLIKLAMDKNL